MKLTPIAKILHRIQPLALRHQARHLHVHIEQEQEGDIHKTSVRIRELQAALLDVQMRRLKRERRAA